MKASYPCLALVAAWLTTPSLHGQPVPPMVEHSSARVPNLPPVAPPVARAQPKEHSKHPDLLAGKHVHDFGALPASEVAEADAASARRFAGLDRPPPRVGIGRKVKDKVLNPRSGAFRRFDNADGTSTWILGVKSPGAFGLRLHLTGVDLAGGSLLVHGEDTLGPVVRGPYTGQGPKGDGDFWTESVPGEKIFLEVTGGQEPSLAVEMVMHFDQNPAIHGGPFGPARQQCHLDVMCNTVDTSGRDAVAQLAWNCVESGGVIYCSLCTGTILNDFDGETFAPYLLTAFHCLSTQAEVDTLEATFLWQRESCGGALPDYNRLPRLTGGTLLDANATTPGNDMTFIRMNGVVPGGVSMAGWTTASPSTGAYGIHHPNGDWKRVHFAFLNNSALICNGVPYAQYHYVQHTSGMMEGGSSGSALFDANGRVTGQLLGSCGSVGCDNFPQWRSIYGRFDVTYPRIRRWLEMGGTIHVNRFYTGVEEGTPARPFNTVNEANNLAWNGARIKIQSASYPETLTFYKQLTLLAESGPVTIGR